MQKNEIAVPAYGAQSARNKKTRGLPKRQSARTVRLPRSFARHCANRHFGLEGTETPDRGKRLALTNRKLPSIRKAGNPGTAG